MKYTLTEYLLEMAAPVPDISSMTFYHGTPKKEYAESILKNGLQPPKEKRKGNLAPVEGKVYMTPHIGYAQIYALGGHVAGSSKESALHLIKHDGQHGYLFKIAGHKLTDVQPDEDSIGEHIGEGTGPSWLHGLANKHIAASTLKKAKDGEYDAYARIGKVLVKRMSDAQKIDLIVNHGAHIAHHGAVEPDEAYEIDRNKIPDLSHDGLNFFDHAKRIK